MSGGSELLGVQILFAGDAEVDDHHRWDAIEWVCRRSPVHTNLHLRISQEGSVRTKLLFHWAVERSEGHSSGSSMRQVTLSSLAFC